MSTLFTTLALAFALVTLAIALLAISWLFKGKSSIRPGACGRDPTKPVDSEECQSNTSCGLCKDPSKKDCQ